ncbi:hypothetical protein [Delftia lacustris]|uniref:Uncharacterized protein n=1 Tax=Delftia lacustris TaxID=558537 RepID=A0A1H3SGP6_9BURK|nr:hypothetical protein [Delftia lacustris]SDZ37233.1 hypothetical protein SAMN05421547_12048 [Delftia lacustris]
MPGFDAGLFKPICTSLIEAFASEGRPLGRSNAHEILAAALGFWTYSLTRQHATPLATRLVHHHDHREELPRHWAHLTKRIEGILGVSTWAAQALVPIVHRIVRDSGLAVDTHSLIYDSEHLATRDSILKAIDDVDFVPHQASVAMQRGLLPYPARTSLEERLHDVAPVYCGEFGKRTAYLWRKPSTQIRALTPAVEDSYSVFNKMARARLGLNFTIVIPDKDPRGQPHFTLLSPTMSFHEETSGGWRVNTIVQLFVTDAHQQALGEPKLEDLIGQPVAELPRVQVCPRCLSLHISEQAEPGHRCTVPVNATGITNAIQRLRESGANSATTEQIAKAMLAVGHVETDLATLEQFLDRHARALWLRRYGGVWVFVKTQGPMDPPTVSRFEGLNI